MIQRQFRTPAIVLRRTNYGEADRVISLLTPDRGKLSAIAKGVRKQKSKLAGGLELLAVCDVTLLEGRGDMLLVTSTRLDQFYGDILHEYERMELAYAFIKDINRVAETVTEPDFYYLLRDSLQYLNTKIISWKLVDLWFRLRLNILLGHGLNLLTDREGNKLAADKTYHFDFAENAFYEHTAGRFNAEHIKLLRLASVKTPAVLRQVSGLDIILDDCLWLVRSLES
jgi:DNA repair protein RecO (recombination protein O)